MMTDDDGNKFNKFVSLKLVTQLCSRAQAWLLLASYEDHAQIKEGYEDLVQVRPHGVHAKTERRWFE